MTESGNCSWLAVDSIIIIKFLWGLSYNYNTEIRPVYFGENLFAFSKTKGIVCFNFVSLKNKMIQRPTQTK